VGQEYFVVVKEIEQWVITGDNH